MVKKIIFNFILISFFLIIILIVILSSIGIETNRFNNLISDKVNKEKDIKLELKTIKFKLDPKKFSLFLETKQPKIIYSNLPILVQNIKLYISFLHLLKADFKIKKIDLALNELDINQLKNFSQFIKPSNFKSILNNKIKEGKITPKIEFFFDDEGVINNYIIKGDVKNLKINIFFDLNLLNTKFSFFADKEDILVKNIFGNIENIKIYDGDLKLNLINGIKLNSNFNTDINLNSQSLSIYDKFLDKYNLKNTIENLNGNFNNSVFIDLDNTYKLIDYNYNISGKLNKSKIKLPNSIKNTFIKEEIENVYLLDTSLNSSLSKKIFKFNSKGKYSFDNLEFLKFNLDNSFRNNLSNMKINLDFNNSLDLSLINYKKPKNIIANLNLALVKKKDSINVKELHYSEKNNYIKINDLKFKNNNFLSFKKMDVKTLNNNFFIQWNKKILIKGTKFDATNLPKFFSKREKKTEIYQVNKSIEIDFENIKAPLSEKLKNFRLIGVIENGKFTKISSKGDFGGNNFLDISLKKDKNTNKKFLEIYSDLTRPLLTEYKFFSGLSGGKLLFTSLIDEKGSNSKLRIENFKVVNAPGVIKLLSLADLGGLADLAEGDGLSFNLLEINMEKNNNLLKLNEIIALGPSMSVLMEGYQDYETDITSLKGTLVPAKTLNKIISKIPVIGNIVIPKEVGEGLFGISFKIKGPKKNIKTTINPIRTLTPRFIQKIVERNKETK